MSRVFALPVSILSTSSFAYFFSLCLWFLLYHWHSKAYAIIRRYHKSVLDPLLALTPKGTSKPQSVAYRNAQERKQPFKNHKSHCMREEKENIEIYLYCFSDDQSLLNSPVQGKTFRTELNT